jgi:tetraacyldisaccharide 4'-kinase
VWYGSAKEMPLWAYLLLPLRLLFWLITSVRRRLYARNMLSQYQSKLPIVIVGNISVGGNGKTPLVLALVQYFHRHNVKCAILSRGYGGSQKYFPYRVTATDSPQLVGDEPALMVQRLTNGSGAPAAGSVNLVIDPLRARGAKFIEANSDAQVIICDDGLQHYALARDIELCVMDKRGIGNGCLLPQGPLREPKSRLRSVDWIIYNGHGASEIDALQGLNTAVQEMHLAPSLWKKVNNGEELELNAGIEMFSKAGTIAALAGIGDPNRFFTSLNGLGLSIHEQRSLPDHHAFSPADIPDANIVLMTEKDAIKCKDFAADNCWYLQVDASISEGFYQALFAKVCAVIDNNKINATH